MDRNETILSMMEYAQKISEIRDMYYNNDYKEDFRSIAYESLINSVDTYDTQKGCSLKTYVGNNVGFGIKNWLRKNDFVTRRDRATYNSINNRGYEFVSKKTGKDMQTLETIYNNVEKANSFFSECDSLSYNESFVTIQDKIDLNKALNKLDNRSLDIIYMKFYEDKNNYEIAAALGLSVKWVHVCYKEALGKLNKFLQ